MSTKRIMNSVEKTIVDMDSGEIVQTSKIDVYRLPTEPPYVKMYIEDLCALKGVSDADQALLRRLLIKLDYEGYVALTPRSRDSIAASLDITRKTLRNRLSKLVNSGLLKPTSLNEYMVNPNYFAKGCWKSICEQRKAFELTVKYSEEGREIKTICADSDAG